MASFRKHKYLNPYNEYLDTSFKFPKGLYQVFDILEAIIDDKKIIGLVGEKKEVRKIYRTEYVKGNTVVKTEEIDTISKQIPSGIMITNIGNIPPKKELSITFSFICIISDIIPILLLYYIRANISIANLNKCSLFAQRMLER